MERISGSASREVISASTAHQMADLLTAVVENGTGEKASVNGYRVAAKTGTSWKYFAPEDSYESPDGQFDPYLDKNGQRHYTSTVTGFFPSQKPELSMIVIIDDPAPIEEQFYASHVAAPLFGKLASWSLRHYQISPFKEIQLSRNDQQALSNPTEGVPFPNRGDSE
jgi:cell division protein FtsI/penicillin-binding protein 2